MKIKRVELKNIRNHADTAFDFEQGINLILGENGSGKTTILDAIGMTLFDIDSRTNNKDTVSDNETTGQIKVIFTGNDGEDYTVVKKFPQGNVSLSGVAGKKSITGKAEVYAKIHSLIGNYSGRAAIFENVIVARQNSFTSVFSDSESGREKSFNAVFDTGIYREMYNGVLKNFCDRYAMTLVRLDEEIRLLAGSAGDIEKITEGRKIAEAEYARKRAEADMAEKKTAEAEKILKEFEERKSAKEKNEIRLVALRKQFDTKKKRIEEIKKELEAISLAEKELKRLEPEHKKYAALRAAFDEAAVSIAAMEKFDALSRNIQSQIHEQEKESASEAAAVGSLEKQIADTAARLEQLNKDLNAQNEKLAAVQKELKSVTDESAAAKTLHERFLPLGQSFTEANKQAEEFAAAAARMDKTLAEFKNADERRSDLSAELKRLTEEKITRDDLLGYLTRTETMLSELKSAEKELSGKNCPFLKEECRNIASAGSVSGYFAPREKELNTEIAALKKNLVPYNDIDARLSDCTMRSAAFAESERSYLEQKSEALQLKNEELTLRKQCADIVNELMKLFPANSAEFAMASSGDSNALMHHLQSVKSVADERVKLLRASLAEQESVVSKSETQISDEQRRDESARKEIEQKKTSVAQRAEKITALMVQKADADGKCSQLGALRTAQTARKDEIDVLEGSEKEYVRCGILAGKAEEITALLHEEEDEMKNITEEGVRLKEESAAIVYSEEEHAAARTQSAALKNSLKEQNDILSAARSAFDRACENEKRAAELLADLAKKKTEREDFTAKAELAKKIRENVKDLGPYVAERRTRSIAAVATENFRRMTGRNERILWENAPEQYQVSLMSGESRRNFSMLSGGEQVAVALSIRSALAAEMTGCNFVIFDEPTINLDAEKREALSVSLNAMLRTLEQALVVTHDAVFREMATKVIELKRR